MVYYVTALQQEYGTQEKRVVATVALFAVLGSFIVHFLVLLAGLRGPVAVLVQHDTVLRNERKREDELDMSSGIRG